MAIKYNTFGVYLNCDNVEKSAAFYEALGFKRVRHFPEMNVFTYQLGSSNFVIGPKELASDEPTKRWLAFKPWGVGCVLMPNVKNVDEVYEVAKRMGAEIQQPPKDEVWGSRTLGIADPDGYSLLFEQDLAPAGVAKDAKKAKSAKTTARRVKPKARSATKGKTGKRR